MSAKMLKVIDARKSRNDAPFREGCMLSGKKAKGKQRMSTRPPLVGRPMVARAQQQTLHEEQKAVVFFL